MQSFSNLWTNDFARQMTNINGRTLNIFFFSQWIYNVLHTFIVIAIRKIAACSKNDKRHIKRNADACELFAELCEIFQENVHEISSM